MQTYGQLISEAITNDRAKAKAAPGPSHYDALQALHIKAFKPTHSSDPTITFNFTGLPFELQVEIIEYLDFYDLKLLEVADSAIQELISANLTPILRTTLFRTPYDGEALRQAKQTRDSDYLMPIYLHPILEFTKLNFSIPSPYWDAQCVVEGDWDEATCRFAELVEMGDNATQPPCLEMKLSMWNICWRSTTSSHFDHSEDAEHFQPVKLLVKAEEGKTVKVKDVIEAMQTCMEFVRGRMDWETQCHARDLSIENWYLHPSDTDGRLRLQDEWDTLRC